MGRPRKINLYTVDNGLCNTRIMFVTLSNTNDITGNGYLYSDAFISELPPISTLTNYIQKIYPISSSESIQITDIRDLHFDLISILQSNNI